MGRSLLVFVIGLLIVLGVEFGVRGEAEKVAEQAGERKELRAALENMDISAETFEMDIEDFLAAHPSFPEADKLRDLAAAVRGAESARTSVDEELRNLAGGLHGLNESQLRARLLELQRTLPMDDDQLWRADVKRRTQSLLTELNRRHEEIEAAALEETIRASEAFLAARNPAGALRRLSAFRAAWPSLAPQALRRLKEVEDEAIEATTRLADEVLLAADSEGDPLKRRELLGAAYRGLAGTPQGERVADALRFTRTPLRPSAAVPGSPGATPPGPDTPSPAEAARLAKAAAAEQLVRDRQWPEALVALKELIDASDPGLLQREWLARSDEIRLVLDLVKTLGEAATSDKPPQPKLPGAGGRAMVVAADPKGVEYQLDGLTKRTAWSDVADEDLLPLLTPAKPTPRHRLGLAALAAGLSFREEFVAILLPLFEQEKSITEASLLVARYLDGRGEPPPGGYRAFEGEILDNQTYERRMSAVQIATLSTRAREILAKVEKDGAFKKLGKLKKMRADLDEARRYALLAIFNEKHYPYPANKQSQQYQAVQKEIDRRVDVAREIWNDPLSVKISRKGPLKRLLDEWDRTIAELKQLDADVADLESAIAPYTTYVTGEPFTIREYALNGSEAKLQAYNRWVMEVYNPKQDREATGPERQQTRVTNEYRMLLGYAAAVTPGQAPYDAIDGDTVVKILDGGRILRLQPLMAVRIDDRLVRSSRDHSLDMQRRSYFAHQSQPNPATGDPGKSPFQRMQEAGYQGMGASENIAQGTTSPEQAHWMWIHSSGHHRNILSNWHDQGVGQAGRLWTQNFGLSGGRAPRIENDEPPSGGAGAKKD